MVLHKRLIAIVTGVAAVAGILYCLQLPALYTATTRILTPIQPSSSAALLMNQLSTSSAGSLAAATGGSFGLRNPNDIYIGLLRSRPIADAIIQRFQLCNIYRAKDMTSARNALEAHTKAISEKGDLIAISVTDKDRTRASGIANEYTKQLRILTQTLAVTEASQRRVFYEAQLKGAKDALDAAVFSFQQVQQKKGLVQPDAQARALVTGLADLHAQIGNKEVELQSLRSFSTEHNPAVQLAENELTSLREQMSSLQQRSHTGGPANQDLPDVAGAGLEYLHTEHEMHYRQALFDLMIKQYDAAQLDEAKEGAVVQIVESAIPPDNKSSPHRVPLVMAFTILGFLGACSYISAVELVKSNPVLSKSLTKLLCTALGRSVVHGR
jgi:capsule polysaccharide export protein KpsE/RkpR